MCFSLQFFSQQLYGIVTDEDQNPLPAVLVFNLQTEKKAYTDLNGQFTIEAKPSQGLRFVREGLNGLPRL
ncbi:carboxypeptidase-like regulatory domain-containing protein [Chryseobacterium sp. MP_3.2]|uniref:carboxypeptidase-like regulatory domain-containing protein n=1 Tax=Chryseobacterium sp. MP_3.2 TaxID=3071712 RepID=UPI002E05989A|nr:hypothetical protein [Chryseobacterium sp. MP_3.2]